MDKRPIFKELLKRIVEQRGVDYVIIYMHSRIFRNYLTPDPAAAGRRGAGRYIALGRWELISASMTEPGRGYCQSCSSSTAIPTPRTR